jgi:alpha-L-rhamnosidase
MRCRSADRKMQHFRSLLQTGLSGFAIAALACPLALHLCAQNRIPPDELDPARNPSQLRQFAEARLTEEYIWARGESEAGTPAHETQWVFRREFSLNAAPRAATLYVAASGDVEVWLNGTRLLTYLDDRTRPPGYTVHALDVAGKLGAGPNVLAIGVRRLHGAHHTTTDPFILQFVGGRALAVKLVPADRGVLAAPLLISDALWRGRVLDTDGVSDPNLEAISTASYDSSAWPRVVSLGGIESNIAFYQWNADAGMYAWPGYVGASAFLRHYTLRATQLIDVYAGSATLLNSERLTRPGVPNGDVFTVRLSPESAEERSPALMLDFGREVAGRIHLRSASGQPILVTAAYGESEGEALHQPFLGVRTIFVPPNGEAWGPKSGFRYVRLRFLTDARLSAIDVDGIAYPVEYKGSFASNDRLVDRIWETGAYTAHLCMQDGVWDGIKRDRARWAGDLNVSGGVINDVFGDRALMEDTYTRLLDEAGGRRAINGIAGYSALWIDGVADFYRHSGDRVFLLRLHGGLLALLKTMDGDINSNGLFVPGPHEHVFVDWSPGLSSDTPEARRATDFEYLLAFKEAAWLLGEMGDGKEASNYEARYRELREKARALLRNAQTHEFGTTWQTNAMAVLSGAADAEDYPQLWKRIFSNIDQVTSSSPVITPYYGYYVLEAMARLGHRAEALQWMRDYWGGMIAEGATSFWESYDPRWTKHDFHTGLQADGRAGYYVSLAHGWSAGPTAWLSEQVLGIRPTGEGFRTVTVEPELAGLSAVEGSEPTPHGNLQVSATGRTIVLDLPPDVDATVLVRDSWGSKLGVNGRPARSSSASVAGYRSIHIDQAGHYVIAAQR